MQDYLVFIELRTISVNSRKCRDIPAYSAIFRHKPRNSGIFRDIPGFHNAREISAGTRKSFSSKYKNTKTAKDNLIGKCYF
jgi:RNA:NAD 2'-phosphotransferase (TPT1/KptA family)